MSGAIYMEKIVISSAEVAETQSPAEQPTRLEPKLAPAVPRWAKWALAPLVLLLPLLCLVAIVLRVAMRGLPPRTHPNPLEARAIGALVSQYEITFLLATPTFLQSYMRRCSPEDFGSLQYVMAGAEKLPERVSVAFEDRFGIRPLEGYGCTECSPALSVLRQ